MNIRNFIIKKISSVSSILGLNAALAAVVTIVLARELSKEDFGKFALIRILILFLPHLALWGQSSAFVRFFSNNHPKQYRWQKVYSTTLLISLAIIIAGTIISKHIYQLNWWVVPVVIVTTLALSSMILLKSLLNSQKKYNIAILFENGYKGCFFFPVIILVLIFNVNFIPVVSAYCILIILFSITSLWYTFSKVPKGSSPVPSVLRSDSFLFTGILISLQVMATADKLLITKLLSYEDLALYTATLAPLQLFPIVSRATKVVLLPLMSELKKVILLKYILGVTFVSLLLVLFYISTGKFILHFIYSGKFDEGLPLLYMWLIAGVGQLFYSIPSSLIAGRLNRNALKLHMYMTVFNALLNIGILYYFIKMWGLIGVASALAVTWLFRNLGAYFVAFKFIDTRAVEDTRPFANISKRTGQTLQERTL